MLVQRTLLALHEHTPHYAVSVDSSFFYIPSYYSLAALFAVCLVAVALWRFGYAEWAGVLGVIALPVVVIVSCWASAPKMIERIKQGDYQQREVHFRSASRLVEDLVGYRSGSCERYDLESVAKALTYTARGGLSVGEWVSREKKTSQRPACDTRTSSLLNKDLESVETIVRHETNTTGIAEVRTRTPPQPQKLRLVKEHFSGWETAWKLDQPIPNIKLAAVSDE